MLEFYPNSCTTSIGAVEGWYWTGGTDTKDRTAPDLWPMETVDKEEVNNCWNFETKADPGDQCSPPPPKKKIDETNKLLKSTKKWKTEIGVMECHTLRILLQT